MRVGMYVSVEDTTQVEVTNSLGDAVQVTFRDPDEMSYVRLNGTRTAMVRLVVSLAEQLQTFTPIDLSEAIERDGSDASSPN